MKYWLLKTEPHAYSWNDLEQDSSTTWDGVRNFQARNYLKAMEPGDLALFYHSGDVKAVVGIAKVTKGAFADPADAAWTAVGIERVRPLKKVVTLKEVKANAALADMVLVKSSRLSVQPVQPAEFDHIVSMSESR